ncbi:energy-coupling factor transporter transmembrane component T family protein [Angustibacter aerolatus]
MSSPIGLYVPGTSPLHRCPPGPKLLGLLLLTSLVVLLRDPAAVGAAAVVVGVAVLVARLPLRVVGRQLWPLRWFLALLVPLQWWQGGPRSVVVVAGTLLVCVAAATVVTLTTQVSALLELLERRLEPLRRLGIRPERVALTLVLTVRAVPVVAGLLDDVRDARRARGLERSPRALLVPLVVRTVRYADRLGEALVARGVDD